MDKTVFEMIIEGAKAEGKRIREAVEAAGNDKPIDARPGENERYDVEVDFRDGKVSLRGSYDEGTPGWIADGHGVRFRLNPSASRLALAEFLEESSSIVARIAHPDADQSRAYDQLTYELASLSGFDVMNVDEWYSADMPDGTETGEELAVMASSRDTPSGVYLAFSEEDALDWLKRYRSYAREELEEAA